MLSNSLSLLTLGHINITFFIGTGRKDVLCCQTENQSNLQSTEIMVYKVKDNAPKVEQNQK